MASETMDEIVNEVVSDLAPVGLGRLIYGSILSDLTDLVHIAPRLSSFLSRYRFRLSQLMGMLSLCEPVMRGRLLRLTWAGHRVGI